MQSRPCMENLHKLSNRPLRSKCVIYQYCVMSNKQPGFLCCCFLSYWKACVCTIDKAWDYDYEQTVLDNKLTIFTELTVSLHRAQGTDSQHCYLPEKTEQTCRNSPNNGPPPFLIPDVLLKCCSKPTMIKCLDFNLQTHLDALLWLETNETRQSSVLRVCIANLKSTTMLWAVRVWKVTPSLPLISNVKHEHSDRGFELWLYSRYRHRGW